MKRFSGVSPMTGQSFEVTETEDLCSVELAQTAKGEVTVSVKAYAATASEAEQTAVDVYGAALNHLRERGIPVAGDTNTKRP